MVTINFVKAFARDNPQKNIALSKTETGLKTTIVLKKA
jgi:hypothetical protein